GELPRANFVKAEDRVAKELKALNKPFVIVLNTTDPAGKEAKKLAASISEKHGVPALPLNVAQMGEEEINSVIEEVLFQFPIKSLDIDLPRWMQALPQDNPIIADALKEVAENAQKMAKMCDYKVMENMFENSDSLNVPSEINAGLASGTLSLNVTAKPELFYKILSEECGETVENEYQIMNYVRGLKEAKVAYFKLKQALFDAQESGYGVVTPSVDEMTLNEPEVVKQGGRYGVKLKAQAPSLHIMKVDVEAEVSPIVASEQQGEELVKYLLSEFENNPGGIWDTNMFGKPLSLLVRESIAGKIDAMPKNAQNKMRKTVTRIVNEGKGGVLCILL
ncbi:MAG: stage IV sporulation protein A, partial [Clostridia bacterium]|nr:stage IV sporulation protein A [Clostridia bacterium]